MKLALNGALTVGTLDGANIEIKDNVGADNIFIFGLTAQEVEERLRHRRDPLEEIAASPLLEETLSSIATGRFSPDDPHRYAALVDGLKHNDRFMLTADFDAYFADSTRGRRALARPSLMAAQGHPEHGAHGLVLVGPDDPRICRGHLARSDVVVRKSATSVRVSLPTARVRE